MNNEIRSDIEHIEQSSSIPENKNKIDPAEDEKILQELSEKPLDTNLKENASSEDSGADETDSDFNELDFPDNNPLQLQESSENSKNDGIEESQESINIVEDFPDNKEISSSKIDKASEDSYWEKHEEFCKEAFGNSSVPLEKDQSGNDYKALTQIEKEDLSSNLKEHINSIPQGERGDYRVPEPEKIRGLSQDAEGNVKIDEAWTHGTDGAKEHTREMKVVSATDENGNPTYIDRIGNNNGSYFSPMDENGNPYSLRARAIGDYLPYEKIELNDSYHRYEVKQDLTRENFEAAIDKTYTDLDTNEDKKETLEKYYQDAEKNIETDGHDNDAYQFSGEIIDGVKTGTIDNMFGTKENPDGGGKQYITPFSAEELEKMGMIEEIKKENYI